MGTRKMGKHGLKLNSRAVQVDLRGYRQKERWTIQGSLPVVARRFPCLQSHDTIFRRVKGNLKRLSLRQKVMDSVIRKFKIIINYGKTEKYLYFLAYLSHGLTISCPQLVHEHNEIAACSPLAVLSFLCPPLPINHRPYPSAHAASQPSLPPRSLSPFRVYEGPPRHVDTV